MSIGKSKFRTLDMAYIAIGAAIITVCSWISIPMSVPFTFQTFAVFLLLSLLGGERGTMAILVYVMIGAIGVPVFSGFGGGMGVLLGATGGYIVGFLLMGFLYSVITRRFGTKLSVEITALSLGLLVCYAFGTTWFMYVYTRNTGTVGLISVLSWCVFPFIIPDLAKLALALFVARRVRPVIK
ncbi:MAG: biotin transporter BioY [Lachnospiraceae bacterium]|nr:biotin transporter BioY [Lachnospiraceae bacterium]